MWFLRSIHQFRCDSPLVLIDLSLVTKYSYLELQFIKNCDLGMIRKKICCCFSISHIYSSIKWFIWVQEVRVHELVLMSITCLDMHGLMIVPHFSYDKGVKLYLECSINWLTYDSNQTIIMPNANHFSYAPSSLLGKGSSIFPQILWPRRWLLIKALQTR